MPGQHGWPPLPHAVQTPLDPHVKGGIAGFKEVPVQKGAPVGIGGRQQGRFSAPHPPQAPPADAEQIMVLPAELSQTPPAAMHIPPAQQPFPPQ